MSGKPYFPKVKRSSDLYPLISDADWKNTEKKRRKAKAKTGKEAYDMLVAMNDRLPKNW